MNKTKPIIAIVGRPNVGKSTFFNRVTKTRDALVDNYPGVTRDSHYGDAKWDDAEFTLVDTGGFSGVDDFALQITFQVRQAIEDADLIILMMDGKEGVSPYDTDIIDILRPQKKPVFYVVNKIDGSEKEVNLSDFYSLGIGDLYPISSEHRYGITDLMDNIVAALPAASRQSDADKDQETISIAVVGRPNAGKSSLINKILGKERLLVSHVPGTTRDSIDTVCKIDGKLYRLIDTAGIRRKGKVSQKLEKFSIIKALRSLDRCDVALIILDADEGITDQDINVAGYAYDRGCGCILVLNKWDLIEKDSHTVKKYYEELRYAAKYLNFAPVLTISALTGLRVRKIFNSVDEVYKQYTTRISTGRLNRIIEKAVFKNEPSLHKGRRIKFYYSVQISVKPPTFVCFVNYSNAVHFSYKRYLTNKIREGAKLDHTPIRLIFRQRERRQFNKY